jgi:hypothetical protein
MPLTLKLLRHAFLLILLAPIYSLAQVTQVPQGTVVGDTLIDFTTVSSSLDPGTNYDTTLKVKIASFGERFGGQTVSSSGDFDVLSGNPTAPLTLQAGAPGQNFTIFNGNGSNNIAGIGYLGYPNASALGEGCIAVLFDEDQSEVGFDDTGTNGGYWTITFYRRNGTLISSITTGGFGAHGFRRDNDIKDIAGFTVTNTDPYGESFTNFRYGQSGLIKSVQLDVIDSAIDDNPNAGGGKRIFPDKQSPTDTVNRKRVRVTATTNLGSNQTVYFKSFDLDDPSSNIGPIDTNDLNGPAGDDNRGTPQPGILSLINKSGTTNTISAKTDRNGIAQVDFTVTVQPGDNFTVAASEDQTYLNALAVNGINLRDGVGNNLPTRRAKSSPMLTVWRRLHMEVDSMGLVSGNSVAGLITDVVTEPTLNTTDLTVNQTLEENRFEHGSITAGGVRYDVISNTVDIVTIAGLSAPPIGSAFTLVDDDDFNNNDAATPDGDNGEDVAALAQTFSRMQDSDNPSENVYAAAYIRPIYDGGGSAANNNSNVAFVLNSPNVGTATLNQINLGRTSGTNESDSFWVAYVQIGYQPEAIEDSDPDVEDATGAYTPRYTNGTTDDVTSSAGVTRGADGSLLFIETMRDRVRYPPTSIIDTIAAPHEVGHQFGLKGDALGFGIMFNSSEAPAFVDRHLNMLRWRVKSPGQP